jgi:hypothetical protein
MIHEFHLAPPGEGRGVSCDANGAFVGDIPLLKLSLIDGSERWQPRECGELSKAIGASFGLPIDMSSKMGGVRAISNALNDGDVARAQIATVLLGIPELPDLSKDAFSSAHLKNFVDELQWSGLLKADWDADEHPRWPAGAPDSQGGQFAPKGDDAGQTDAATPRASRDTAPDAAISPRQRFYGDDIPSNIQPALRDNTEGIESLLDNGTRSSANDADDFGTNTRNSLVGDVQVAATGATTLDELFAGAIPANWKNLLRLPNGALKLGTGEIITAASLLTAIDAARERAAVDAAFAKFGLDPTNAADVLAIRAYVWAQNVAPWHYFGLTVGFGIPPSGPQLESVSQFIMALELARPGTLGLATNGDAQSNKYLDVAAELGMQGGAIFESRRRPANMPPALQTTSESARAAANLQTNDQMRAHHLIPANVWGAFVGITPLAHKAGWVPETADNLIGLPANEVTQKKLIAEGMTLPIHSTSHSNYDGTTTGEIIEGVTETTSDSTLTLTPAQALAIYKKVELEMRERIMALEWWPRLY